MKFDGICSTSGLHVLAPWGALSRAREIELETEPETERKADRERERKIARERWGKTE